MLVGGDILIDLVIYPPLSGTEWSRRLCFNSGGYSSRSTFHPGILGQVGLDSSDDESAKC